MGQGSGDDPKVEIRDYCFQTFLPQAFVKLKKEENASLVFGKLSFHSHVDDEETENN